MATRTLSDQANEVLSYLGVLAQGQSASAEDKQKAEDAVTSAYRRLRMRDLAPYALATIPERYWVPLEKYVAAELAPKFGKPRDPMARDEAEREMRELRYTRTKSPGFVARGKYH